MTVNKSNIILILLLTILSLVTSCSDKETMTYRIGVSQCSSDAWRTKLNEEMRRELLFHPGITLEVRSADADDIKQAEDIDYFISQKVDLLIVSPNKAAELTPAVSRAFDAGIPVIVADRKVTGEKYTAFVGGDNLAVGELMAQYLQMQLPQGGKVLEVMGLAGSTPSELRHEGMVNALGDRIGQYEFVQAEGDFFEDKARNAVAEILPQNTDIDIVLAQNDLMAIGAREAIDSLMPGHAIIFMGVDGLTGKGNGVEAIAEGKLDASAVYATGGDLIIQTAVQILEGQPYERNRELASYLIDPSTAPLMNNIYQEVDHEVETIHMLKGRIDYYWQQHNLEQTLLISLLVFLFVVIVFLSLLYRNYLQKQRLNESLARQKEMLKEQRDQLADQNQQLTKLSKDLEEATRAKLHFFTNVSHDFRTPLTLINGPIGQLMDGKVTDDGQRQQLLRLAYKNVQVLLRLVNQILDFRKYENGKLELNLSPIDMQQAVEGWYESFKGLAYQKHIRLELKTTGEKSDFYTKADLAKVERIFFNLMGNAFKFTPENGRIVVELGICNSPTTEESSAIHPKKNILFRISDTGPGISVEHIKHIFENFYQVDAVHHEGSGIGLALVKSFVELHGGTIEVENQPEGTGSIFTVMLPAVEVDPNELPSVDHALMEQHRQQTVAELTEMEECDTISEDEPKPIVLVIDDNPDIRGYMQTLLATQYRVLTASHGQEGIRKAMRVVPDLIICDVMMPGMDGIECCRRLKAEVNTCHIPVLMLTACSLDEQRVQGLVEGGSDAYMAKPFNADVLMAQLDSLLRNHNRVRDFFRDSLAPSMGGGSLSVQRQSTETAPMAEKPAADAAASLDDRFLQRVYQIIEKHLSDEDFGVETMGEEIGMSRAQLYRKCKALTNYSPVEIIRNTRLKRAQQMLAQGDETIAQVAYQVGFSAPSYFTKCYKEFFGESPNELVKRKG